MKQNVVAQTDAFLYLIIITLIPLNQPRIRKVFLILSFLTKLDFSLQYLIASFTENIK